MSAKKQANKVLDEIIDEIIAIREAMNYGANIDYEDIQEFDFMALRLSNIQRKMYKLVQHEIESNKKNSVKGDVYLAKITRVEPSLQAALEYALAMSLLSLCLLGRSAQQVYILIRRAMPVDLLLL